MKVLAGLALATFLIGTNASAATAIVLCNSFSNPNPNNTTTYSWTCPGTAGLGTYSSISGYLILSGDFSNGLLGSITETTTFNMTYAGGAAGPATEVVTTTGNSSTGSAGPTCANTGGAGAVVGPSGGLPGCIETLTGFSTSSIGIAVTNAFAATGSALQGTGFAEVVYTYTPVTSGTPEPISGLLFGSGLLAVALVGRKRFSRS